MIKSPAALTAYPQGGTTILVEDELVDDSPLEQLARYRELRVPVVLDGKGRYKRRDAVAHGCGVGADE
ncbi:hypothetical protein ABZ299_19400 [Streptomyces sp. NPDC006184]|uniref:hypothetical protein n=1 Tax=Streptomyces sp. NPDC006184 TaxID=3155455 RepID=UPI00339EC674